MEHAFTHLTEADRRKIYEGIVGNLSKKLIAEQLGKDSSTIGKEIKARRKRLDCGREVDCASFGKCKICRNTPCSAECHAFSPFYCARRDRSPGACDGCYMYHSCKHTKYSYDPHAAQEAYEYTLTDSRTGQNFPKAELEKIAAVVSPLIKQGLSPYQIVALHPELDICAKTLYNYIEDDVFHFIGDMTNLDLRRQTSRRKRAPVGMKPKPRTNREFLKGRTMKDLEVFRDLNPGVSEVEMDTVYNDGTNGPFIQTFLFKDADLFFAVFHSKKTTEMMVEGVNLLEEILGPEVFRKYVGTIITDRGSEFSDPVQMEFSDDNSRRTYVFYCDPLRACQKGAVENRHVMLRYILPKGKDLYALGLVNQEALNLVLCHLNSAPLQKIGKSPFAYTEFCFPDLYEKFYAYGLRPVDKDSIVLKPALLKPFRKN